MAPVPDRDPASLGAVASVRLVRAGTLSPVALVDSCLAAHDALLSPVAPSSAPAGLGSTGDPSLCAPWSWAGVPAVTLPSGLGADRLPHAVQLVQAAGADAHLLNVALWCERVLGFSPDPPF